MLANYRPPYALVRPEWSKGWGYTARGPWTSPRFVGRTVRESFRARAWNAGVSTLDRLDPHAVFTSPLLRALLRSGA